MKRITVQILEEKVAYKKNNLKLGEELNNRSGYDCVPPKELDTLREDIKKYESQIEFINGLWGVK